MRWMVIVLAVGMIGGCRDERKEPIAEAAKGVSPASHVSVVIERPLGNTQPVVLYEVPKDKWFVLTDVQIVMHSDFELAIYERDGKHDAVKIHVAGNPPDYHSAIGISFRPGTSVVSKGSWYDISITGYLAD